MMTRKLSIVFSMFLAIGILAPFGMAQTTGFIYQGSLNSGGVVANGNHDFEFALFDAVSGGAQLGATLPQNGVAVTNGIFAVSLDFGSQFPGAGRFLEIRVRPTGGGAFTPLTPRQQITSAPYAVKSLNSDTATTATTANNALQLGGVAAGQYVLTADPRLTDDRVPRPGSLHYIQNTVIQQPASDFHIGGIGRASIFEAATQFNIGGNRVLRADALGNTFAGVGAGTQNFNGVFNSFFGLDAGLRNTDGAFNSFFGRNAGFLNTTGGDNSFFGQSAGSGNTIGGNNSFFGSDAGRANTIGRNNSFFGRTAGLANTIGGSNSFFGVAAGFANTTGVNNAFYGLNAGSANTMGGDNSFFGTGAGSANTIANFNSFFGYHSGFSNTIGGNNSFFGRGAGFTNTEGSGNSFFGRDAGLSTNASDNSFFGYRSGFSNTGGSNNSFFGRDAGFFNETGGNNSFFGSDAGGTNSSGGSNSFFGRDAGVANTIGGRNSFFGHGAGRSNTTGGGNTAIGFNADIGPNITNATAIGAGAVVTASNQIVLGRQLGEDSVFIRGALLLGSRLQMGATGALLTLQSLGSGGTNNFLCRNAQMEVSTCSSSSMRYKSEVRNCTGGLDVVSRLRPISFNWKQGGMRDVGFGAEEVEKVEPLLAIYNDKGEIEGVKYQQITTVLVNAVNEQQTEIGELRAVSSDQARKIEDQSSKIKVQQKQIDTLTRLVCASNKDADICKEQ